jgi:radical SAM superfamily enzyme YgiQ (UPF0313 family)
MTDTVGRNDPCPCGSGKKYKHCCGRPKPPADVLYIHPAKQGVDFEMPPPTGGVMTGRRPTPGRPYGLIPLGLPAVINVLRDEGFEVAGVNVPWERKLDPSFDLRTWLRRQPHAKMVLIDLHWYEHAYGAISVAQVCKEVRPDVTTVLGGLTASGFADEILATYDAVDFVIRGDAEAPMLQLARSLTEGAPALPAIPNLSYREAGAVHENPLTYTAAPADLDRLNYVDLDFLEHHTAYLSSEYLVVDMEKTRAAMNAGQPFLGRWIATARGCKYECSYCGGCKSAHRILAGRDGIIPRSPEAVVDELARLADLGVHQAALSYDVAVLGESYWRRFFSLMRKRDVTIGLYNEFFQLPPASFMKHFARSVDLDHSCLALSPLSGSERVRRLNGKQYTDAELINILDYLNLYNVSILVYFSLNLPGEDEETIHETVALAETIYHHYPSSLLKIINSCHTMDPLSPMQQHADKYGIEVSWTTFMDFYTYCRETQIAGPEARTGAWRGFEDAESGARSVEAMADVWDRARRGREACWWPIPPSW